MRVGAGTHAQVQPLLQLAQTSANPQVLGKNPGTLAATQALLGSVYLTSGRPARALQSYVEAHNMYDLHRLKRPMWLYSQWTEAWQKLARNDEVDVVLTLQKEAVRQKLMED